MTSAKVQQRLLAKGDPALAECVKECRTTAATSCQAAEIHTTMSKVKQEPREQETRGILYTQQAGPRHSSYSNSGLGTACKFCNRQHGKRNCPAFGQVCRSCGRRNHFAVVCKEHRVHWVLDERKSEGYAHIGTVTVISSDRQHTANNSMAVNRVRQTDSRLNAVFAILKIQKMQLKFQVDSGASCNILRMEDLRSLNRDVVPVLKPTHRSLRMYDGSICKPLGVCSLPVSNPKTVITSELEFMVVSQAHVALLGCAASQILGLLTVNTENIQMFHVADSGGYLAGNPVDRATGELPNELKDAQYFLDSYKDVFNGELGCLAGTERLEVNPEVVPVKMPLRKVPISVQNRLEEEIRRLETLGVIEKITEPTDWVSGLVVAEKKNGKLRICIDPKPLNKALRRRTYPMPTMEDVLPRLNKAKVFTVCDVKNGFWHVQLEEQSSVPTCSVTSRIRFDRRIEWKIVQCGPLPVAAGRGLSKARSSGPWTVCRPAWTCGNDNPTRGVGAGPLASTALAASPLVPWTLRYCPPPCAGLSISYHICNSIWSI